MNTVPCPRCGAPVVVALLRAKSGERATIKVALDPKPSVYHVTLDTKGQVSGCVRVNGEAYRQPSMVVHAAVCPKASASIQARPK